MDRWQSKTVQCKGGLDLSQDALTQGTINLGTAIKLQNYEPSLEGGYSRILGYTKWDTAIVPGEGSILGVKVALGGVFAARDEDVYFSSRTGWTKINSAPRPGNIVKYRLITYSLSTPAIVMCDGVNPAAKYDGTTYTLINGTGAPANPKYAQVFLSRLVLSGYSSNPRAISISAPNADTNFNGVSGAIEINVGDIVVGLRTFRETPYIFCQDSIFKLAGSSSADFAIVPVTRSIGCISGDTIQEIGGDLLFLAPDGLRSLAATDRIGDVDLALKSRAIQPIIRDLVGTYDTDQFSSCVIRKKSQYRTFVFDPESLALSAKYGGTTAMYDNSIARYGLQSADGLAKGILGKLTDNGPVVGYEWATTLGINAYSTDSEYTNNEEITVFGHPATGYVYRLESGADFDGSNVEYVYKSPFLTFDDASLRKVMQKITVYTQIEGNIDALLHVKYDFENAGILQPSPIQLNQVNTLSLYGAATYNTSVYNTTDSPVFHKNLIGSGFTAAFQFSGSDTRPVHRIDSFQIQYSLKGRR